MTSENKKLQRLLEFPSWELVVLALLMVTVLGVALRGPMETFPGLGSRSALSRAERDPYDIQPERVSISSRNRVETGL